MVTRYGLSSLLVVVAASGLLLVAICYRHSSSRLVAPVPICRVDTSQDFAASVALLRQESRRDCIARQVILRSANDQIRVRIS